MSLSPRSFQLLLAMTPGMGGQSVTRVVARNNLLGRTPDEFLSLSEESLREEYRLSAKSAHILSAGARQLAQEWAGLEHRLTALGVHLVTGADAHYPALVEEMDPNPPGLLFLYGNTKLIDSQTFCVLASRNSRAADLDLIERLTEEGVLASEVLVAGHDRPEYQRSAVVPLRWGSPRILCLDRGLFKVFGEDLKDEAFRAARLWRYQFDPDTDLAISPFRPEADFIGVNNKVRDRLVASLSRRLDFVHIGPGGNMAAMARLAIKAGRPTRVSDTILGYREFTALGATTIPTR